MDQPRLSMRGIRKSFGTTLALRKVDLDARPGSIHALIGENGAGKSTLMKVLSGALRPDGGSMTLEGRPFAPSGPAAAQEQGIAMVYQELTLAPHLSVLDNLFLGRERPGGGPWSRLPSLAPRLEPVRSFLDQAGVDPKSRVADLGIGAKQMVEIARALLREAKVLVLDEPTAGLSAPEAEALFQRLLALRETGVSILYISHFLEEVKRIAEDFTVLRDGESVAAGKVAEVEVEDLVAAMIGRRNEALEAPSPRASEGAETPPVLYRFRVDAAPGLVAPAHFDLRRGEIAGIAGLVGSGRTELLRTLTGLPVAGGPGREVRGRVEAPGPVEADLRRMSPARALRLGYGLLSEDRKAEGLALRLSVADNLTLPYLRRYLRGGLLRLKKRAKDTAEQLGLLQVKAASPEAAIDSLSGGNQQKVAIGRLLSQRLDLLLLDEPTRGVDLGAKAQIYALIRKAAAEGKAVLVVSSYLPELFGLCHSLMVMHKGRLSAKRPLPHWTPEGAMAFATTGLENAKAHEGKAKVE